METKQEKLLDPKVKIVSMSWKEKQVNWSNQKKNETCVELQQGVGGHDQSGTISGASAARLQESIYHLALR